MRLLLLSFLLLGYLHTDHLCGQASTTVPFRKVGKSCHLECTINGYPVEFTFDTGAELVCIPRKLAKLLLAEQVISPLDLTGEKIEVQTASGHSEKGDGIIFQKMVVGEFIFTQIAGVVMPNDTAGVLLGQTLLEQLSSYTIDNDEGKITFYSKTQQTLDISLDCDTTAAHWWDDRSLTMEQYIGFGMKPVEQTWSEKDYAQALALLELVKEKCPGSLPRKNSKRSGPLFEKIASQKDLVAFLGSQVAGKISQLDLNTAVINNSNRLFELYGTQDTLYGNEIYELYNQNLYQMDELAGVIKQVKGDNRLLPAADLENLKDYLEHGMNMTFDLFLFGDLMLGKKDLEKLMQKVSTMLPAYLKVVGRSQFKANIREQAWVLAELAHNEAVQQQMGLLYQSLRPNEETKEEEKEKKALLQVLRENTYFAFICLSYNGRFSLRDEGKVLEYTMSDFEPKIKVQLALDKNGSDTILGKQGSQVTKTYSVQETGVYDALQCIVRELTKVY